MLAHTEFEVSPIRGCASPSMIRPDKHAVCVRISTVATIMAEDTGCRALRESLSSWPDQTSCFGCMLNQSQPHQEHACEVICWDFPAGRPRCSTCLEPCCAALNVEGAREWRLMLMVHPLAPNPSHTGCTGSSTGPMHHGTAPGHTYVACNYVFMCVYHVALAMLCYRRTTCTTILIGIILLTIIPGVSAPDPNTRNDYDYLAGVPVWDGLPRHDFLRVWFVALGVALGSVVQDGYTLLQTAEENDAGRDPATDDAADVEKHRLRVARLASSIKRYISATCYLTQYINNPATVVPNSPGGVPPGNHPMAGDGVAIYKLIKLKGNLPYSEEELQSMRDDWDRATMHRAGIKITLNSLFEWVNWIRLEGDKLGKSLPQERKKFLAGLPESFQHQIQYEVNADSPGQYVFPTHWPAGDPRHPAVHPKAGQPDIELAATKLYPLWEKAVRQGKVKAVPKGYTAHAATHSEYGGDDYDYNADYSELMQAAAQINDDEMSQAQETLLASRQLTPDDICAACGGRGHFAKVGNKRCLTVEFNTRPPEEELNATVYPRGLKSPKLGSSRSPPGTSRTRPAPARAHSAARSGSPQRRPNGKGKGKGGKGKPGPGRRSVYQAEEEPEPEHEQEEEQAEYSLENEYDPEGDPETSMAVNFGTIDITPPPEKAGAYWEY